MCNLKEVKVRRKKISVRCVDEVDHFSVSFYYFFFFVLMIKENGLRIWTAKRLTLNFTAALRYSSKNVKDM